MSPDNPILTVDGVPDVYVLGTSHFPGPQGPPGPIGPPGDSAGNTTIVDLTSSQLLDLINTPIEVLPAQGPGTIVFLRGIVTHYTHNTAAYYGQEPRFMYDPDDDDSITDVPGMINKTEDWIDSNSDLGLNDTPESMENKSIFLAYYAEAIEEESTINYYGTIDSHELGSGGQDYVVGETGAANLPDGQGIYEVLSVDGAGAVLTYSLVPQGDSFMISKVGTITTYPGVGIGSGFEIEVLSVIIGDGDIRLYLEWQLFFLSS